MKEASPREDRDAEHKVGVLARYAFEIASFRTFEQKAAADARRKGLLRRLHAKTYRARSAPDWEQLTRWRRWRRSGSHAPVDRR